MYEIKEKDVLTVMDAVISARILTKTFDSLFFEGGVVVDKLESLSELFPLALRMLGVNYTDTDGDIDTRVIDKAWKIIDKNMEKNKNSREGMYSISKKICEELKNAKC